MLFKETPLKGAYIVEIEPQKDERGFFARSFCLKEFAENGLNFAIKQSNISHNKKKGTLRGMHYQISPHEEKKIVSCARGAIFDVIIDLRLNSSTYLKYFSIELTDRKFNSLFIPEGFAHGFQTLFDDTTVIYQMSEFYQAESARGVRWNDKSFDIPWPSPPSVISPRDAGYADFRDDKK